VLANVHVLRRVTSCLKAPLWPAFESFRKGAIAKPPRLSGVELTFLELIQSPTRFAVTVRFLRF
jgi:hypothetical protein